MKSAFHYLGSVYFAVLLILTTALMVIAGTFIESRTESHRYAAYFTYDSALFALLLWGFFINILFAALRRWPFRQRHVPFLITHLGLLMILGGTIIKHHQGLQGTIGLMEGSESDQVFIANTHAISIETRTPQGTLQEFRLLKNKSGNLQPIVAAIPDLAIRLLEYHPHAEVHLDSWIKGNSCYIAGIPPFAIFDTRNNCSITTLPVSSRVTLFGNQTCDLMALRCSDPEKIAERVYQQQILSISPKRTLLFAQDEAGDTHLYAYDLDGQVSSQKFSSTRPESLSSYNQGYAGYAVSAGISFTSWGVKEIETPLTISHKAIPSLKKMEDNIPVAVLQVTVGAKSERISLPYDKFGTDLKWPVLDGAYLVSFRPLFVQLPQRIRLRQARQINYPGTSQPYSYESDLIINGELERTISMNNVFESWDGYRFYLANISPGQEGAVKMAQIVVNYDPAKYYLTYPGALILTIGILLLFWLNPYKHKS